MPEVLDVVVADLGMPHIELVMTVAALGNRIIVRASNESPGK
jgi:hypothetical protein